MPKLEHRERIDPSWWDEAAEAARPRPHPAAVTMGIAFLATIAFGALVLL